MAREAWQLTNLPPFLAGLIPLSILDLVPIAEGETAAHALAKAQLADGDVQERANLEPLHEAGETPRLTIDMPDVMAGLDLFVLASTSGEGSPAVLKEAMAAGVPVAAAGLDGVEEIIEDARHGLLTPPGDAKALARAVVNLSRDGDLRRRLAGAARRRAESRPSPVVKAGCCPGVS